MIQLYFVKKKVFIVLTSLKDCGTNLNLRSVIVLCLSAKRGRLWRRRKREAVRLMVKGSVICRVSGGVAVAACGAGAFFSKGEPR